MINKFYKSVISFPNFKENEIYQSSLIIDEIYSRYPHLFIELTSLSQYKIVCGYVGESETFLNDISSCSYVDFVNDKQNVKPITIMDIASETLLTIGDFVEYYKDNTRHFGKILSFEFSNKLMITLDNVDVIEFDNIETINEVIGIYYDSSEPITLDDYAYVYDRLKCKYYEVNIDKKRFNTNNFIYFKHRLSAVRYCFMYSKIITIDEVLSSKHERKDFMKIKFTELFGDKLNVEDDEFRTLFE